MKRLQLSGITAKTVRDALKGADTDVVIYDGDEPLVRLVSVAAEMKARRDFFTHYPHDPAECFHSCWRHDGSAEAAEPPADTAVELEKPIPVG